MVDYNKQTQVLEKLKVTDNLLLTTSVNFDESQVYLDVDYMDGKFTVQRTFTNNYIGLEELETAMKEFNTEDAVKSYFGL
tara:strand:- start:701 stop:940 length:240 start_codon:yes stop_codon:yes gene_type:complete